MSKEKNIFIAHCGEHEDKIDDFKKLMDKKGFTFKDSSHTLDDPNNAHNEEYAQKLVRDSIRWAGSIIVLIGKETAKNDWVNWEIKEADTIGDKQIIGVYLQGCTQYSIPPELEKSGSSLVCWNSDAIEKALKGGHEWCNPDGSKRQNRDYARGNC